jgi:2-C-methyl-D-erythritol 4-phosphate cytidylyltransferase
MAIALIVAAGGSGTRLGGIKKQFRHLGGKSVLQQTLNTFAKLPEITQIVVALPQNEAEEWQNLQAQFPTERLCLCKGGATRQASVLNALSQLSADIRTVLVHDAVRPFIQENDIRKVLDAVHQYQAVVPVLAVADTLRKGKDGQLQASVSREDLFRMQTPQAFDRKILCDAYQYAQESNFLSATDDCELLQHFGKTVHYVSGNPLNQKITTPEDWENAEIWWKIHQNHA